MTGLSDCGFRAFCNRWGPLWRGVEKCGGVSTGEVEKSADQITAHPLVCMLEPLESIVRLEREGHFLVAITNWFEVFMAYTGIPEKTSAIGCADPRDLTAVHVHENRDAAFICGKVCVENLLTQADDEEKNDFMLNNSADTRIMKNAIHDVMKGKDTCTATRRLSLR